MLIGSLVRFLNLTAKPPWTDEFATLVFSLGNNYQSVPLNQVISLSTLLKPLETNPGAQLADVATLLIQEDNHPPLYFLLAHLWLQIFPQGEYINLWVARSLPALLGVLAIALVYCLGKKLFPDTRIGEGAAITMAISPYAVFLSQEARHYTLAILFVVLSLGCCLTAFKYLHRGQQLPLTLLISWLIINILGLGIHYFFILTLLAEGLTLVYLYPIGKWQKNTPGLLLVGSATAGLFLVWFWLVIPPDYGNGMTDWIAKDSFNILSLISPPFQILATWVTMVCLLPVESRDLLVFFLSALVMLAYVIWFIPVAIRAIKAQWSSNLLLQFLGLFVVITVGIFFVITYGFGMDLTRGARYSFVYFPAVAFLGGFLFHYYRSQPWLGTTIITMALLSSLTVVNNLGYQKYYRPDLLVPFIQSNSSGKILIATHHSTLVQTGEMMGIGWQILKDQVSLDPQFLLIHTPPKDEVAINQILAANLEQFSQPVTLWTVNLGVPVTLDSCQDDSYLFPYINGYGYQLYHCDR